MAKTNTVFSEKKKSLDKVDKKEKEKTEEDFEGTLDVDFICRGIYTGFSVVRALISLM